MFWVDKVREGILRELRKTIDSGGSLVIRDEKTASGRIHVGSMRGVAIHGLISEVLTEAGVNTTFIYEINDFDPMDGLPVSLDKNMYAPYMGRPLYMVPAPEGSSAKNFAEHFAEEFCGVIGEAGFRPEYIRTSELYLSGKMNEAIKTALEKAKIIRKIYKDVSGSERSDDWYPLSVVCEKCGKVGTTKVTYFDGKLVTYTCEERHVEWARGCGHSGKISPFDGNAKLPWKVEWPAKFSVLGVHIEGAGKDHATKGGARDVADHIAHEVFDYEPPFDIPYEFFLVGGKKMSSSRGAGSSAREIADSIPPHILRLALIGKDIKRAFNFEPDGDTIPVLFDTYDRYAEKYFNGVEDDETRTFFLVHKPEERSKLANHFLPRFSQIAFLIQMPHMSVVDEVTKIKGGLLSEGEIKVVEERMFYASKWLTEYAPEEYKFELQKEVPEGIKHFSDLQREALQKILQYIEGSQTLDGQELHAKLHDIRKEVNIEPQEFFSALYQSFLGKDSGPKAGWFLSVLERDFLTKRLKEVSN